MKMRMRISFFFFLDSYLPFANFALISFILLIYFVNSKRRRISVAKFAIVVVVVGCLTFHYPGLIYRCC